jgi:hypothetical protein
MRTFPAGALAFCVVCAASPAFAAGPVFEVNSFADVADLAANGVCNTTADDVHPTCTLRAAVMEANAYAGAEEVTIHLQAGTYTLLLVPAGSNDAASGDLNFTGHVRVAGKGKAATIVDANHVDRVFEAGVGSVVTLTDLRIQGGRLKTSNDSGGGIRSYGALTLARCLVRDNRTSPDSGFSYGGGVASVESTLTISESEIGENYARDSGGGIYGYETALLVSRSTIDANTSDVIGGGIDATGGSLKVVNTTVSGNHANYGAGVHAVNLPQSAIFNNVTLRENRTQSSGSGGGLFLVVTNVALSNSILQNENSLAFDDLLCDSSSSITSNGFNLIHVPAGCPIGGAYITTQLQFASLGDNGGPTPTMALLLAGAAVDTGSNNGGCTDENGGPLLVDQRGVHRPIGTRCDLGAFEREPIGDANGDGVVDVSDVFFLINYLFGGGAAPAGRADVTGFNGSVDISDVFSLINYLFAGGQAPPNV